MINKILKWFRICCMAICTGIAVVQVIYAFLWVVSNGNNMQDFYDSTIYLGNAISLKSDGWRLIGYSLFVRLFTLTEGMLGSYYVLLIYFSQVIISLLCYAQGCKTLVKLIWGKEIQLKWMLIPATYIVTIPIIWQMQFAILPDAVCVAIMVLLFSILGECLWNYKSFLWKKLLVLGGLLLLLGFMHRHYFYGGILLTAMMLLIVLLRLVKKKYRNKKVLFTILFMVGCISITSVASCVGNAIIPKSYTYATYSFAADLWKRFVYPDIYENYPHYTERIVAIIPDYVAKSCDEHYEYYMNSVGPMIENLNPEEAKSIYFELARIGFALHREEMIKGSVKEGIAYAFMPFAMEKYMYNNGNSLYGHNFTRMYDVCPNIASDYMHIGMNGFCVVSVLGVLVCIVDFGAERMRNRNRILALAYCAGNIICVTIPIMFFSIMKFDYRIGLFSVFIWGVVALTNIFGSVCSKNNLVVSEGDKSE